MARKRELLTPAEHEFLNTTAKLWNLYNQIVAGGDSREQDLREFASDLHKIQHRVMAQAAAREHPELYRALGETIG